MNLLYASFDEVPSYKGASGHILANCRAAIREYPVTLLSLGDSLLPPSARFRHVPAAISEPNYLRRGECFRRFTARWIERLRPDLFHFRTPWEGLAGAGRDICRVYEVNGLPSIELPYLYRDATPSVLATLRGWEQQCLDQADAIVCPSRHIRACILERYRVPRPERIHVIPNGYDMPEDGGPPEIGPILRAVYIGTLHTWQGILWTLPAFVALRGRYTLDLYASGARTWREHALRRIERYGLSGHVRLHHPREHGELSAALSRCHLGLAPLIDTPRNREQGCCPLKILDYIAHGLPTVAADLPSVRELITDGANGRLYPANTRRALITVLSDIHTHRDKLPAWRERVLQSRSAIPNWTDSGNRLLDVYRSILSSALR